MRLIDEIREKGITRFVLKVLLIFVLTAVCFQILSKLGIPPITAAILFIFFGNVMRVIFKIICFFVSLGLLIYLLTVIL